MKAGEEGASREHVVDNAGPPTGADPTMSTPLDPNDRGKKTVAFKMRDGVDYNLAIMWLVMISYVPLWAVLGDSRFESRFIPLQVCMILLLTIPYVRYLRIHVDPDILTEVLLCPMFLKVFTLYVIATSLELVYIDAPVSYKITTGIGVIVAGSSPFLLDACNSSIRELRYQMLLVMASLVYGVVEAQLFQEEVMLISGTVAAGRKDRRTKNITVNEIVSGCYSTILFLIIDAAIETFLSTDRRTMLFLKHGQLRNSVKERHRKSSAGLKMGLRRATQKYFVKSNESIRDVENADASSL